MPEQLRDFCKDERRPCELIERPAIVEPRGEFVGQFAQREHEVPVALRSTEGEKLCAKSSGQRRPKSMRACCDCNPSGSVVLLQLPQSLHGRLGSSFRDFVPAVEQKEKRFGAAKLFDHVG